MEMPLRGPFSELNNDASNACLGWFGKVRSDLVVGREGNACKERQTD